MSNLLSELELIDGDTPYNALIYDEAAHNKISQIQEQLDNNVVYNPAEPDAAIITNIGLRSKTYNIQSDLTINAQLIVPKGAILYVGSGVTLTINGEIVAGAYKIFDGPGNVVINQQHQSYGFPEWFGAVPNDVTIDNSIYINKTLQVCKHCILSKAVYYISNSIIVDGNDYKISGTGYNDIFTNRDSTICDTRNDSVTIKFGSQTVLSQINDFPIGVTIENVVIDRLPQPADNSVGIETTQNLHGVIRWVRVKNSQICYKLNNNIFFKMYDCFGVQYFTHIEKYGIRCTGTVTPGVVGNNASIYIKNVAFLASGDVSHYNAACLIDNAPADTFIDSLECAAYQNGIIIRDVISTLNSSNDIHIVNCVVDGFYLHGICLDNLSYTGCVTVENCYSAPAVGDNTYCYSVLNSTTAVSFIGNHALSNVSSDNNIAFLFDYSNTISCKGNLITQCPRPYFIRNGLSILLSDVIRSSRDTNYSVIETEGDTQAILFNGVVMGERDVYAYLFKGNHNYPTEINISGVNSAVCSHIATDGTTDYDTTGLNGSILISGVKSI